MERAVAYIRVSKKEEDIENQKLEIKRYCNYKNLDLIAFFVDEDISGAIECMNRSGFKSMIDFLKNNTEIRNVIFSDLTRLGRNMLDNLKTIRFF
ncbi:MAG: recombinase family protein, partial [Nanoarchaeales archaeon]